MKRMHLHLAVENLDRNIAFYSHLFGAAPSVHKSDYAKWMLEDPRINFAISTRGAKPGLDHLGIQVESAGELESVRGHLAAADAGVEAEASECCYARSDKYWVQDPQGIAWEAYHTLGAIPVVGSAKMPTIKADTAGAACCSPNQTARCN
jgi:catechol 2,3-dioxygenase-like lactoylglutathione lyase family enzyme